MTYEMRPIVQSVTPAVTLTKSEFDSLVLAKSCLLHIVNFEENYNMLFGSYIELQSEISRTAFETALRSHRDWVATMDILQGLNRHVVSFLSIARQYIDHTGHLVSQVCSKLGVASCDTKSLFKAEYDNLLGYRVMEALRRVAQHAMLPTQGISFGGKHVTEDGIDRRRQSVSLTINPKILRAETDFKRTVLDEIDKKAGDKSGVDFVPLVKEYLAGLSFVHGQLRLVLRPQCELQALAIKDAIDRTIKVFGKMKAVVIYDTTDEDGTSSTLFQDIAARIKILQKRNPAGAYVFDFHVQSQ